MISINRNFDVPANILYHALTDIKALHTWFFLVQDYSLEVGNEFNFYESETNKKYLHECKILSLDPNKKVSYTWRHPNESQGSSVVCWDINEIAENQCGLSFTHFGIESFEDAGNEFSEANFKLGWENIINTNLRNFLYGIEKLKFEIEIKAEPNVVWKKLLEPKSYTEWTSVFCEGSYYEGELIQGNRVLLLAPNGQGMYSDVLMRRENELFIFKHIGEIKDKKEQPLDDETSRWTGSLETYILIHNTGNTLLKIEVDTIDKYISYMKEKYPLALEKLKSICEKTNLD